MQERKRDPFAPFLRRQERMYHVALEELAAGERVSCWIPYIFPQLRGLARSRKTFLFGIADIPQAKTYLAHPVLGPRLETCCRVILTHRDKTAEEILGASGAAKLQACATLFSLASREDSVFHQVLEQCFRGERDTLTLGLADGSILDLTYRKYATGVTF